MSEEKLNDLLLIIEQSDKEIDIYLADVTTEQFKKDIKSLAKRVADKETIREAIKRLTELI